MLARLSSGAPVATEIIGGRAADATPFRFDIAGETGILSLKGGAPRGVQSGVLRLLLDGWDQPQASSPVMEPETAVNVAGIYAALRDDIR